MSKGRKPTVETWVKRLRKATEDFNAAKDALKESHVEVQHEINTDGDLHVKELKLVKFF